MSNQQTLWDAPLSRSTDPVTSHQAADGLAASGTWSKQKIAVYQCLFNHDGATAGEINKYLGEYVANRRLPEIERTGYIKRGKPRKCTVAGTNQTTWWIVK